MVVLGGSAVSYARGTPVLAQRMARVQTMAFIRRL